MLRNEEAYWTSLVCWQKEASEKKKQGYTVIVE
jgi:hypothetical protein